MLLSGQPHILQILCSSVRVKLLARVKLIFLREQPDDFFFLWGTLVLSDKNHLRAPSNGISLLSLCDTGA